MTEIVKLDPSQFGIEESKATQIAEQFKPMLDKMVELENEYNEIIQLPVDKETCTKAKTLRLKYVKVRTGTAEIHKQQKAFYLAAGRYIDGWKNAQLFASEGIETKLESIEKHFENIERERLAKLKADRIAVLSEIVEMPENYNSETLTEDAFKNLVEGLKLAKEAKEKAEREAEEKRKEQEAKESRFKLRQSEILPLSQFLLEGEGITIDSTNEESSVLYHTLLGRKSEYDAEQERIRVENERLKAEAEKKDAILKQRNTELRPYIAFIRDYQAVLDMNEDDYQNELKVLNQAAMDQAKHDEEQRKKKLDEDVRIAEELAEQRKEREKADTERKRLEAELKAREEAEKVEQARKDAEAEALLSRGDAEKFEALVSDIQALIGKYEFKSAKFKKAKADVETLLQKTVEHANSKK
jgi:hypothetical protein